MVVACTQRELVVVAIFGTHAPLHLLQLFLEAVWRIAETFHDAADRRDVVVVFLHALLVSLCRLALILFRIGGHEQFVGIGSQREAVVLVYGNHQRSTQAQVGGNEL